jgi:hypothetical protein
LQCSPELEIPSPVHSCTLIVSCVGQPQLHSISLDGQIGWKQVRRPDAFAIRGDDVDFTVAVRVSNEAVGTSSIPDDLHGDNLASSHRPLALDT